MLKKQKNNLLSADKVAARAQPFEDGQGRLARLISEPAKDTPGVATAEDVKRFALAPRVYDALAPRRRADGGSMATV